MKVIINNRLKHYRRWHRLSLRELGKLLRIDPALIWRIENGKVIPSLKLAFRIARCFGKKLEQVFWTEEKEK